MFKFLGLLFVFGFLGFLIFGVFLSRVIRFFSPSSSKAQGKKAHSRSNTKQQYENTPQKKFAKDEGEYVSFEEIKDEK